MLLLISMAWADSSSFAQCMSVTQSGSPGPMLVVGADSQVIPQGATWRVVGLWAIDCDGKGFFEIDQEASFDHAPLMGEVATSGASGAALRCRVEACAMPKGLCPQAEGGYPVIRRCADGGVPTDAELGTAGAPAPPGQTVMVKGRPVVVAAPSTQAASSAGWGAAPTTPTPTAATVATPSVPAAAAPTAAGPSAAPAAASATPKPVAGEIKVPAAPRGECNPSEALAAEARKHVDLGNEAELRGDMGGAVGEYKAAITMNACHVPAWVSLGQVALRVGQPAAAAQALEVAVTLQPSHYGAATSLGMAYEKLGQREPAIEAYRKALAARPDHAPAAEGLRRLGASP